MHPFQKYLTEFIGTFFLMFIVAFTQNPIAIGMGLAALIYMGGSVSGAHYNPAVTLGLLVARAIGFVDALFYILFQTLGALVAMLVFYWISSSNFLPLPSAQISLIQAASLEGLITFVLVWTVLHVAVAKQTAANQYFGFAIGMTVFAGAMSVGALSGGVFNPAIATASYITGISRGPLNWDSYLMYVITQSLAGLLAGALFSVTYYYHELGKKDKGR